MLQECLVFHGRPEFIQIVFQGVIEPTSIGDRLGQGGAITGVDINQAYLSEAGEEASGQDGRAKIDFVAASFDPLKEAENALLRGYLKTVVSRVSPYLELELLQELHQLVDAGSPTNMLDQPQLTMTWLNVLAMGRKLGG